MATHISFNKNEIENACRPVPYNCGNLPIYYERDTIVNREFQVVTHVHEDIEVMQVLSGRLHSAINDEEVYVEAGECLFINANQFHWNMAGSDEPCHVRLIVTGQELLSMQPVIRSAEVLPLLQDASVPYMVFQGETAAPLCGEMEQIIELAQDPDENGLEIAGRLHLLYAHLYRGYRARTSTRSAAAPVVLSEEMQIQQSMVDYITNHYAESITLDEVAAAGNVSRARCCRLFQKYIRQSPMNFLNEYRLSLSLTLLQNTDLPVSEIALSCGFGQQSHYNHLFRRQFDCSPKGYRTQCRQAQIPA